MTVSAPERFWTNVDASGDCWEWQARRMPAGYGSFVPRRGHTELAHRFAYEDLVGPIPDGLEIDHLCRNRGCVNPDHLEAVTRRENQRRGYGVSGRAARQKTCINGHAFVRIVSGTRRCVECYRLRDRQAYHRQAHRVDR